jgi:hypothetical protein
MAISNIVFDTKYGKIIKPRPHANGTTALCRLPYMKNPSPIEPKRSPQSSDVVSRFRQSPVRLQSGSLALSHSCLMKSDVPVLKLSRFHGFGSRVAESK